MYNNKKSFLTSVLSITCFYKIWLWRDVLENSNRHIIIIFDFSESFRRNFQTQVFLFSKSYFRQIAQFSLISACTRCTCTDQSQLIFSDRKFWSIISRYKFSIFFYFANRVRFFLSLYAFFPIFKRPALLVRRLFDKNCQIAKVFKK